MIKEIPGIIARDHIVVTIAAYHKATRKTDEDILLLRQDTHERQGERVDKNHPSEPDISGPQTVLTFSAALQRTSAARYPIR